MTTATITAYQDGKFHTVERPEWWDEEVSRLEEPGPPRSRWSASAYGMSDGDITINWPVESRDGVIVKVYDNDDFRLVLCVTEADYLDFMTTRLPVLVGIHTMVLQAACIDNMTEAVIDYVKASKRKHARSGKK